MRLVSSDSVRGEIADDRSFSRDEGDAETRGVAVNLYGGGFAVMTIAPAALDDPRVMGLAAVRKMPLPVFK